MCYTQTLGLLTVLYTHLSPSVPSETALYSLNTASYTEGKMVVSTLRKVGLMGA